MALKTVADIRRSSGIKLPKAPTGPKTPVPYDPAKQAAGFKTRLEGAGIEKATEPRGAIEKALNLPANQGWVFDVFEIINRPQQAIFGGIASMQQGQSYKEGFQAGLTGEKFTTGKDLLLGSGMTWKDVKLEETDGKWWKAINAIDIAGFALDVFADPIDVALFPVSAFTGVAKKAVDTGLDTFRAIARTADTLDATADIVRTADQAAALTKQIDAIAGTVKGVKGDSMIRALKDAANAKTVEQFRSAMSNYEAVAKGTRNISLLDYGIRGIKAGGTKTLAVGNDSIKRLLGGIDGMLVRSSPELAEKVSRFGDTVLTKGTYESITKWVTNTFNQAAAFPGEAWRAVKKKSGLQKFFQNQGISIVETIEKSIDDFMALPDNKFTRDQLRALAASAIDYEDLAIQETLFKKFANFKDGAVDNIKQMGMTPEQAVDFGNFLRRVTDITGAKAFLTPDELLNPVTVDGVRMVFVKDDSRQLVYDTVSRYLKDIEGATNGVAREIEELMSKETLLTFEDAVKKVFSNLQATDPAKFKRIQKQLALYQDVFKQLSKQYDVSKYFFGDTFSREYGQLKALPWGDKFLAEMRKHSINVYDTLSDITGSRYALTAVRKGELVPVNTVLEGLEDATGKIPTRTGTETVLLPKTLNPEAKKFAFEGTPEASGKLLTRGNTRVSADRMFGGGAYSGNLMYKGMIQNMISSGNYTPSQLALLKKQETIKIFEEFIDSTLTDFVLSKSPTSFQAKLASDIALAGTFSDPNLLGSYNGFGVVGKTRIRKEKIVSKLQDLRRYQQVNDGIDLAIGAINKIKGDDLMIDNVLRDLLTVNTEPSTLKTILIAFDQVNTLFKTTKLFRFAFHTVNFTGNLFNMAMAGINPLVAFSDNAADAYKLLSGGPDLLRRVTSAGAHLDPAKLAQFTPDEQRLYTLLAEFASENLPGQIATLQNYDDVIQAYKGLDPNKKNIFTKVLDFNGKLNEKVDNYYRLITFLHAKKNPDILARYNMASAADLVRRVHFDPSDLSGVEKDVIRRLIPFYTFTKKNLAYQLRNVADNPALYNRFVKAVNGTWRGVGIDTEADLEEYKRQNFWLPLMVNKDGEYIALKANLPFGDLIDFLQDPANKVLTSLSPFIRAPLIELPTNTQLFTGLPIQEFEGQRGFRIPQLTRGQEYLLGQTGLDVPIQTGKDIIDAGQNIYQRATGQYTGDITEPRGLFSSAVSAGSVAKNQRSRAYEELRRLQDLMRWAKQEEIDVPTLTELENRNTTTETLAMRIKRLRRT
jgi:hypothetical protein